MTFSRIVVAPMNEATLQEMPRFSRYCRYSASVFHLMSYLMSLLLAQHVLAHAIVDRPHRFAFAHDLRRHALADLALRSAILDQRLG